MAEVVKAYLREVFPSTGLTDDGFEFWVDEIVGAGQPSTGTGHRKGVDL